MAKLEDVYQTALAIATRAQDLKIDILKAKEEKIKLISLLIIL